MAKKTTFPKIKTEAEEIAEFRKAAKAYTKKALKSKKSAIKALQATGMYTPTGRLKKQFR